MRKILLILALIVFATSDAFAGGRAGCRGELELNAAPTIRCSIEQTLFEFGPLEIAAGARVEPLANFAVSPYTAIVYNVREFWLALELGWNLNSPNPFLSLAFGFRW